LDGEDKLKYLNIEAFFNISWQQIGFVEISEVDIRRKFCKIE
jgi:hypothetical protein